jgi:redox-sensitive bicupin YhaK (pirin superfamily)
MKTETIETYHALLSAGDRDICDLLRTEVGLGLPNRPIFCPTPFRSRPMSIRPVIETRRAQPHVEGAGVHLHRAFGFQDPTEADPFLLFDDFRGDRPRDYMAGFPWHPHRGIETITYVLAGTVEHGDSLGNRGILGPGSLQLMTAGRGILHQEMPKGDAMGRMHGFQLWGNLPQGAEDDGTTLSGYCRHRTAGAVRG